MNIFKEYFIHIFTAPFGLFSIYLLIAIIYVYSTYFAISKDKILKIILNTIIAVTTSCMVVVLHYNATQLKNDNCKNSITTYKGIIHTVQPIKNENISNQDDTKTIKFEIKILD